MTDDQSPASTATATVAADTAAATPERADRPEVSAARSRRDSRVVAACVITLGLAVAGLLVWKAATDEPTLPTRPVATTVSTPTTGG